MLKDLLLAELALELAGQGRLFQLAGDRAVLAEENGAGQLLGNRAGAFLKGTAGDVAQHRPADANQIDAVVLVKAAIFGGDEGPFDQLRHLATGHLVAGGGPQLLDHLAIGR